VPMDQELYKQILFKDCNLNDPFFDSLKEDYREFETWFNNKSSSGEKTYVSKDISGNIRAFLYIKENDNESIGSLPAVNRMKIGTLKVDSEHEGQRLGEGAIGIALWKWQLSPHDQIYVTVFPKHEDIIGILIKYGFKHETDNSRGEFVFVKDKTDLHYDDHGFSSFPYIRPNFRGGKYVPIEAAYHDQMFPYSTVMHTNQDSNYTPVSNGIVKNYIATPKGTIIYRPGDIALIYRISPDPPPRGYKSVITSFCTISSVTWVKKDNDVKMSYLAFVNKIGNKTVYNDEKLKEIYKKRNIFIIELIYNGYLGARNNVTYNWLKSKGMFEGYPYEIELTHNQVLTILKEGGKNENNIIIDKSRTRDEDIQQYKEV
jgi:hypothetical protein